MNTKEQVQVVIKEEIERFEDKWDYATETHYTKEWIEIEDNVYSIEVTLDKEGNIIDTKEEVEGKVYKISEGIAVLDYEILY